MAETSQNKRVAEIYRNFRRAQAKRREREQIWQELDAYDRNQQWDLEALPPWLPKPVTNFVHLVKYTKRAAFAVDNPQAKLRPVSPEGEEKVRNLNQAFDYVWHRIKARKIVRDCIATAKLLGDAFAYVYWDETAEGRLGTTIQGDPGHRFEGEIRIKEIDPSQIYPDPDAFDIQDCRYIIVTERKPLAWIKNHPKLGKNIKNIPDEEILGEQNPQDRGEIYLRDYSTESHGIVTLMSYYEKKPNEEGGFTYSVTYLVGDRILYQQNLKPNRYPFVRLSDFKQRHSFWSMSTCEFILDNQRIINKVESIIVMIGTLMQNPQKIVSADSRIDPKDVAKYGNMPGMTWLSHDPNPERSIVYVQPPQIPMVLFHLLENAKENIREITGLTQAYLGQTVGSLQTSSGVQALIERATLRDRDQMYDIELFIEELTQLVLDFMIEYYDTPRMIRISGANPDEYEWFEFNGVDYRDIDYDIYIDVSAKAPITRLRESEEAKELLVLQGQYGQQFGTALITPQEFIEKSDFVDKDKIIQRMNMEELRNKTEEAMRVATMMNEALQRGVPPEEVLQMGYAMFEQMEQEMRGIGSARSRHSGQIQQQQAGTPVL